MTENNYKYAAKFKQPQTVSGVRLNPNGGYLSERQYKTVKKDPYGASMLEKGMLIVAEAPASARTETVPDFEGGGKGKRK
jgi:hypothetical protein